MRIGGERAVDIEPDVYTDPAHPEHSGELRSYQVPVPAQALVNFRQGQKMWLRFYPGGCQFGPDKILEVKHFAIVAGQLSYFIQTR
ncbi:hypothetical protein [Candidatus Entotheonella palauensis]|uniref:Uncharacterized protein n=1 Tax=Candidatus Entotheonella gemina TaxID=1429439 RepID=W4LWX6_9BACT|nr:hypothetical protein [Candidatus Entotheonella palauensis]ETX01862.1 MAG: hypothetical protein ETSY2_36565 [Candidatus Entotheonella gemina]